MTPALLGGLAVLALMDSTSFGTLLIPIWLMLVPGRLRAGQILVFLTTVAAFYFALGELLTAGIAVFSDELSDALDTTPVHIALLVAGVVMLVAAFRLDTSPRPESGRLSRWRGRAVGDEASVGGLIALAVTAALIEAGSMVPYLAAIGLISAADVSWPVTLLTLAAYCLVMVVPALVLLAGRVGAARVVEPVLQKVAGWMVRNSRENAAWLIGIVGFLVAGNASGGLGIVG